MNRHINSFTTNQVREEGVVAHFRNNIGKRVFILTEAFPFIFIGQIKNVVEDMVVLDVQTTSVPSLERREWTIHIHSIEVFFIEQKHGPKIPELKDE